MVSQQYQKSSLTCIYTGLVAQNNTKFSVYFKQVMSPAS